MMAVFVSCNQPFDPRGELDPKPVVFSVISTDRNAQFVRVERCYMPAGYDPTAYTADSFISNAVVTINGAGQARELRDTTLLRSDTSRFNFPIRAFVANPLKAVYAGLYKLSVRLEGDEIASGSFVMPGKPLLSLDLASIAVIDRPSEHDTTADILFPISFGDGTYGYIAHLFVYYDVLKNGEWVEERVEVPSRFVSSNYHDMNQVIYPQITARGYSNKAVGAYKNVLYSGRLGQIAYAQYRHTQIIFNRIVFVVIQVEPNLYKYYNVAHLYRDPHSMRLDEPMYSSLTGGVGIFGGYTLDSLVHALPELFSFNHR